MTEVFFAVLLFCAGFLWVIVCVGNVVLPVVYFLPRTVAWANRGWVRWRAVPRPLEAASLVFAALVLLPFVVVVPRFPALGDYLVRSAGWNFGCMMGLGLSFIRLINSSGRSDLRKDFYRSVLRSVTARGAPEIARLMQGDHRALQPDGKP